MASETATNPSTPGPQLVCNAFVDQYYHILHHTPESAYRFYKDSSMVSRPDSNGVMTSVTTMKGIDQLIMSLKFKDFKAEIKTAEAQKSYKEGVTVLVTGCLTGKDNLPRKFAQSFFLAPQENGYFVLNDVFRYFEDSEPSEPHPVDEDVAEDVDEDVAEDVDEDVDAAAVTENPEPEPGYAVDPPASDPANSHVNEGQIIADKASEPPNHPEAQVDNGNEDNVEPHIQSNGNDNSQATEQASSAQEDAPKKSYASIVKVHKGILGPAKVYVPTNTLKTVPNKTEIPVVVSEESAAVPEAAQDSIGKPEAESSDTHGEVEGYSIYVRNLPFNVTVAQLEEGFKKFGSIKPGSIQIRNNRPQGYCFGFVEFLSLNAMHSAVKASPVTVAGRLAVVEMKKNTTRVDSGGPGRVRISTGRPGFQNDSFRGRGNFGVGGRSFGRADYGNRGGDFGGRGRGPVGHGGRGGSGRFGATR